MADAAGVALRAAARALAAVTRVVAGKHTRQGAAMTNVSQGAGPESLSVRVGLPGGAWGWTPIQAWMLDNNGRHPLFGDRKHWYNENDGGVTGLITEEAMRAGADTAARAFADSYVAEKFK